MAPRLLTIVPLGLMLLILAACTSPAERALRRSPDFRAGYNDGCATATDPDTDRKDADEVASNRAYRTGFGAGYGACRPSTQDSRSMPGNVMTPPLQTGGPGGATP